MGCAFKRWAWSSNCLGTWFRWALPIYPLGGLSWSCWGFLIFEMVFYLTKTNKAKIKHRFRISLPVIFAAFIPAKELKRFNQFLQKRELGRTHRPLSIGEKKRRKKELEILVHTDSNLFGAIGHVDICYQGKVIFTEVDPWKRPFGTIGGMAYCLKWIRNHTSNDYVKRESKDAVWLPSLSLPKKRIRQ